MAIPKIIHQVWLDSSNENETGIPKALYKKYSDNIKQLNPDFKYMFWNNTNIKALLNHSEIAKFRFAFDHLRTHIERCDFIRYVILYLYGGIYIDLDYICKHNLSELLNKVKTDIALTMDPIEHIQKEGGLITNSVMMSKPNHPFWLYIMNHIALNLDKDRRVMYSTGPKMLYRIANEYGLKPDDFIDHCHVYPYTDDNLKLSIDCKDMDTEKDIYLYSNITEGTKWNTNDIIFVLIVSLISLIILLILGLSGRIRVPVQ